jgi:hypothetical protein
MHYLTVLFKLEVLISKALTDLSTHEANIRGGGKTVQVVFTYLSRSLGPTYKRYRYFIKYYCTECINIK